MQSAKKLKNQILFFTILFYVFSPSPTSQIGGISKIVLIFSLFVIMIKHGNYKNTTSNPISFLSKLRTFLNGFYINNYREIIVLIVMLFYSIFELIYKGVSFSNLYTTLKPFLFLLIIALGYLSAIWNSSFSRKNQLLRSAYLILAIQYIIGVLQLFDINFLSFLYNDSKSFPIWHLVRLTGTFGNPNIFSWFICVFTGIVLVLEEKRKNKLVFISLGIVFLFFGGSRTMLMIAPMYWIFQRILKEIFDSNIRNVLKFLLLIPVFIICFVIVLIVFKEQLPYASQLLTIFTKGLASVNSFRLRIELWNEHIVELLSSNFNLLLGIRKDSFRAADNDLLYGLTRFGIVGTVMNYYLYYVILKNTLKLRDKKIKVIVLTYLIFSLVVGLIADTLMGWTYPVLLLLIYSSFKENLKKVENVRTTYNTKDVIVLVSSLNANLDDLIENLNLGTDAIIVNQCNENREFIIKKNDLVFYIIQSTQRGVSNSRQMALDYAKNLPHEILVFADDDQSYINDYGKIIVNEYNNLQYADFIAFNYNKFTSSSLQNKIKEIKGNNKAKLVKRKHKYFGAVKFTIKKEFIILNDVRFNKYFGPGQGYYSHGEDSVFIKDLKKNSCVIYESKVMISNVDFSNSTWRNIDEESFYFDKGALWRELSGKSYFIYGVLLILKSSDRLNFYKLFVKFVEGGKDYTLRKRI